jgi:hypothetical protein
MTTKVQMMNTSERAKTSVEDEPMYTFTWLKNGYYQLQIHSTGEIREAPNFEPLLRSLAKDEGFYLRRIHG